MDVAAMLTELNEYGFEDTDTIRKVGDIQAAIWEIEGRHPWSFLEKVLLLNFDGSDGTPTNVPADFRASLRMKDLIGQGRVFPKRDDDLEDIIGTQYDLVSTPRFYYFEAGQVKLWPIPPASTGRVRWKYIRWSDAITESTTESGILIPKFFHENTVVPMALSRLYARDDDPEMASYFGQVAENGITLMSDVLFRPQFDMPDYVHVTDPDDFDFFN